MIPNSLKYNFRLLSLAAFIFMLNVFVSSGQFVNVMISDAHSPSETSIIINPRNTSQLVGGANFRNVYYSSDGGFTWNSNTITSDYGTWGDPCITVDTAGNFFYFHLSDSQFGGVFG